MEELIYRGLLQHAFLNIRDLALICSFPSILFALPHFSSLPSLLDISVFAAFGIILAGLDPLYQEHLSILCGACYQ